MNMYIYKITNIYNNKLYIGITKNIEIRFNSHIKDSIKNVYPNSLIGNAIRKYGAKNFTIETITKVESWDKACKIEKEMILKYNSYAHTGYGYNLTKGGEGIDSETQSVLMKKMWKNNKQKLLKIKRNKNYRQKLSIKQKENWKNKDYREKMITKLKITRNTIEYKLKNSIIQKNAHSKLETRIKNSNSQKIIHAIKREIIKQCEEIIKNKKLNIKIIPYKSKIIELESFKEKLVSI